MTLQELVESLNNRLNEDPKLSDKHVVVFCYNPNEKICPAVYSGEIKNIKVEIIRYVEGGDHSRRPSGSEVSLEIVTDYWSG